MPLPLLATKLYIPPPPGHAVLRPRLNDRLNQGLARKLTLISAPAGFGKTTLVSEWCSIKTVSPHGGWGGTGQAGSDDIAASRLAPFRLAWLSLDQGDNDLARFLTYFIAALQPLAVSNNHAAVPGPGAERGTPFGAEVLALLQSPQPPSTEFILTLLLNEMAVLPDPVVLVLDDYHVVESPAVDEALTFLLDHLPPPLHLVLTTREDPDLPLARLRARGHLSELRAADLRFTPVEAAEFLNAAMGLNLSPENIDALETRTEGWIAGLHLAALALQGSGAAHGRQDPAAFIQSFTGSHRFVLDYLVQEVLEQQPAEVQTFLLRTCILDRMCGPLCEAVLRAPAGSGQKMLDALERANLFIVPLDDARYWYRYHHLFMDLLRQRLRSNELLPVDASGHRPGESVTELYQRASQWYEENGLELEAFEAAAAAQDIPRAERLSEGKGLHGGGIPMQFRGAAAPVRHWLEALPRAELDARPALWVTYASTVLLGGTHSAVEAKLQAAEAALERAAPDAGTRDLVGRIASMRATLAVIHHDVDALLSQSRRALEYLDPDNVPVRTAATWSLGYAYQLQGDMAAAERAYGEVIASGNSFGNSIYTIAATINLGQLQEAQNALAEARRSYERVLQLVGDSPQRIACEAYLGLARIFYQWNDLVTAQQRGQQCLHLLQQIEGVDTLASYQVFLARVKLALRDPAGATVALAEAETFVRAHRFMHQLPAIAEMQVLTLIQQDSVNAAGQLAETHQLAGARARVLLAQGNPSAALAVLAPARQLADAGGRTDERLRVMLLQALALAALGVTDAALDTLAGALALAQPGGPVRLFVDEGAPMARLLSQLAARGTLPAYTRKLVAAFGELPNVLPYTPPPVESPPPPVEPLTTRELQVLELIFRGLGNREIGARLFLAPDTVKGHNRRIFAKLGVTSRTEAIARARELGLFRK